MHAPLYHGEDPHPTIRVSEPTQQKSRTYEKVPHFTSNQEFAVRPPRHVVMDS